MSKKAIVGPIQSTAGAVPVRNEKGKVSMQKVKVHRYVSGKRPDYAPRSSSEDESDDEEFVVPHRLKQEDEEEEVVRDLEEEEEYSAMARLDPRLRRLQMSSEARARRVEKPEILEDGESEEEERPGRRRDSDSEDEDELMDDAEIEKRRAYIRQRALEKQEDELLVKEDEKDSGSEDSESEYEEYTDSEEEARPRLKPVFVFKHERVTIKEKEVLDSKEKQVEDTVKQRKEERRKETLKVIEEDIQNDKSAVKGDSNLAERQKLEDVNTDDENEEAEYEAWKIRELKRVKRDREEREALEREKMEIERLHGLTEEERRLEMKMKPKHIINKAAKGKYKFLQKYYHRGVFYLDREEDVLKRDYSSPTLEDHFDKTILPKVMQVKNFGRSGRTKYTHLVDQDTTNFESPWVAETTQNLKFYASQAAGVRQTFDKPSTKKRKMDAE